MSVLEAKTSNLGAVAVAEAVQSGLQNRTSSERQVAAANRLSAAYQAVVDASSALSNSADFRQDWQHAIATTQGTGKREEGSTGTNETGNASSVVSSTNGNSSTRRVSTDAGISASGSMGLVSGRVGVSGSQAVSSDKQTALRDDINQAVTSQSKYDKALSVLEEVKQNGSTAETRSAARSLQSALKEARAATLAKDQ